MRSATLLYMCGPCSWHHCSTRRSDKLNANFMVHVAPQDTRDPEWQIHPQIAY